MNAWFTSRTGAVALGILAFLTLMARLTFLDALYVPEFSAMLPESQPAAIALTMIVYMVLVGGWVWSLLTATRGSRVGLIVALLFSLLTAFGGGLLTLLVLCPDGCAVWPVGNAIVWANLISGFAASAALTLQLTGRQAQSKMRGEAA